MNRLFLRIFIGFWFTTLVALLAGHQLTAYLNREGPRFDETRSQHDKARHFLRHASRRYRHNPETWENWMQSQQHEFDWLVHRIGDNDFGQRLRWSPALAEKITNRPAAALRKPIHTPDGVLLVRPLYRLRTLDGYIVARVRQPNPIIAELFYRHLWLRLLIALLATGAISYWMVRRYTQPIRELRRATQTLAAGDLGVRLTTSTSKDDLNALRGDFNDMAEQLEESRNRQRSLIHDVSHELRTPLARIKAALALAQRQWGDSPELTRISTESDNLNALIDQLLQEPQRIENLADTLILNSLLTELIENNRLEADQRDIQLTLDSPGQEIWLQAASETLRSALENVLRNAIRHSPPGSKVDVALTSRPDHDLLISIRDTGSGVPEDELDKIFLPFYRVDSSRQRASGGHGLGLAICKRIIEGHGGSIAARNAHPGLNVSIRLPATLRVEPPAED